MNPFLRAEALVIGLVLVVAVVALAVRRLRIPYTVALVLAGLVIAFRSPVKVEVTPELILALFVPPLVFEAAFHLSLAELRRNMVPILILAVPGVVATTLIVGAIVGLGTGLALPVALVFGALIAATDPVAVVALFREIGVPNRLKVLIEGESLLNDGTAIVVFNLVLAVALAGRFNMVESIGEFIGVSAGGTIIGLVLGWLVSRVIAQVDDHLIETTLSTVLAFGAYLLAEQLHVSGVLAVVAAGLVNGNIGPRGMSPTTRIVLFSFWEYIAFLANSLVFLLLGMAIDIPSLLAAWQSILWAILAVLAARILVVHSFSWLAGRFGEPIPFRWRQVLTWGGLRGAISLALALSLPISLGANREQLRLMAYGVVLFTLLVQATTMGSLLRRLRIATRTEAQIEYEIRHARLAAVRAGERHVDRLHHEGVLSTHTWEKLKAELSQRTTTLAQALREMMIARPDLEAEELDTARREILRAERSALHGLRRDGVISYEVFEKLAAEVDFDLSRMEEVDEIEAETQARDDGRVKQD